MGTTSSPLKVASSCGKEILGKKSWEDNDLTAYSTSSSKDMRHMRPVENESCPRSSTLDASLWNMRPVENESCPRSSTLDASLWNMLWNMLNDDVVEMIIASLWNMMPVENESCPRLSTLDASLWNMMPVENESCPRSSTLDASLWNMLNDDVVEMIIARLPFNSLFRVSLLSKAWSHKLLNHSFQSEVVRLSTSNWKSYFPLFLNDKRDLIGYESGSQRWHRLVTQLYFLPSVERGARTWHPNLMAVGGPILCWMWTMGDACECFNGSRSYNLPSSYPLYLCVSNPLMKSWKQLPPCLDIVVWGCPSSECIYQRINVHVDCQGTNAYQVVVMEWTKKNKTWDVRVHIFDSGSDIWTMHEYKLKRLKSIEAGRGEIVLKRMWSQSVYINGVIYMAITYGVYALGSRYQLNTRNGFSLISFHLENKIWSEQKISINEEVFITHMEQNVWDSLGFVRFVVCGLNAMLVVFPEKGISGRENLCVYRLHLESGLAFVVSTAPKHILDLFMKEVEPIFRSSSFYCAAGVGDCIFLTGRRRSSRWLMYSMRTQKWDLIPLAPDKFGLFPDPLGYQPLWTLTAYQPGLNPFLEV